MEGFQKIVLTTAIILLVLALIAFAVVLYNRKFNQEYPPVTAECPDYWVDMNGTCLNQKSLGNASCNKRMNFSQGQWAGDNGMCLKQKWAKACDLTWDGVTNHADACTNE
tara:strand:- start:375 stop:704 length:330 start_codon:yes stop_codon:yes gene_type:complete